MFRYLNMYKYTIKVLQYTGQGVLLFRGSHTDTLHVNIRGFVLKVNDKVIFEVMNMIIKQKHDANL